MLYLKECKKVACNIAYYLFIVFLLISWYQNFSKITQDEIDWANGGPGPLFTLDRPLLAEPTPEDTAFGSKSTEDPEKIMRGATDALLAEYKENIYATYPFGNYKAVSLNMDQQARVLEILCEITGLTPEQLDNLPEGYFPTVNGSTIHFGTGNMEQTDDGGFSITVGDDSSKTQSGESFTFSVGGNSENHGEPDISAVFTPQVSYERFKALMSEMENMIGEKGNRYTMEMMITYYGLTDMSYDEAMADYQRTVNNDQITGGFARLFCDYMGQVLGLYPIFLIVVIWLKDKYSNMDGLIYSRKVSTIKLLVARYLANITMLLLPIIVISFQSLLPLIHYGAGNGLAVNPFAFIQYILWWLLPTVMAVTAIGTVFTLLTDTPAAILLQAGWWFVDRNTTGLSGDTGLFTLMVRHNTLRGYEIIEQSLTTLCLNRLCLATFSIMLIACSMWILAQKRKGKLDAKSFFEKWYLAIKNKLGLVHPI